MAGKWVKSLQCKSRAADDVILPPLIQTATCRNSFQGLKDVVARTNSNSSNKPKPKPEKKLLNPTTKPALSVPVSHRFFPSLSDLPEGHPSRNVVEIIFHTRWGPKAAFPGRVEMVFKIQNSVKTLTRFEDYRESVKSRAGSDSERVTRCAADGNEMMRFYCLGPTIDGAGGMWEINGGGKARMIGTFSGSGAAHDKAGGGRGRRAMLVCRVIAGRVGEGEPDPGKGFDSVNRENGELLVCDARAVLPCFLVFYKL